jgi:hypothetical protein
MINKKMQAKPKKSEYANDCSSGDEDDNDDKIAANNLDDLMQDE